MKTEPGPRIISAGDLHRVVVNVHGDVVVEEVDGHDATGAWRWRRVSANNLLYSAQAAINALARALAAKELG